MGHNHNNGAGHSQVAASVVATMTHQQKRRARARLPFKGWPPPTPRWWQQQRQKKCEDKKNRPTAQPSDPPHPRTGTGTQEHTKAAGKQPIRSAYTWRDHQGRPLVRMAPKKKNPKPKQLNILYQKIQSGVCVISMFTSRAHPHPWNRGSMAKKKGGHTPLNTHFNGWRRRRRHCCGGRPARSRRPVGPGTPAWPPRRRPRADE